MQIIPIGIISVHVNIKGPPLLVYQVQITFFIFTVLEEINIQNSCISSRTYELPALLQNSASLQMPLLFCLLSNSKTQELSLILFVSIGWFYLLHILGLMLLHSHSHCLNSGSCRSLGWTISTSLLLYLLHPIFLLFNAANVSKITI